MVVELISATGVCSQVPPFDEREWLLCQDGSYTTNWEQRIKAQLTLWLMIVVARNVVSHGMWPWMWLLRLCKLCSAAANCGAWVWRGGGKWYTPNHRWQVIIKWWLAWNRSDYGHEGSFDFPCLGVYFLYILAKCVIFISFATSLPRSLKQWSLFATLNTKYKQNACRLS